MKRIAYHPDLHPALPWCVVDTSVPQDMDISRFPKLALFRSKAEALAGYPEAAVDEEYAWECGLRIETSE